MKHRYVSPLEHALSLRNTIVSRQPLVTFERWMIPAFPQYSLVRDGLDKSDLTIEHT